MPNPPFQKSRTLMNCRVSLASIRFVSSSRLIAPAPNSVSFQKAAFPVVQLVSNEVYMSAEPATLNEPEFIGKNISLSTGNYHPP